jgi:hypothetical protein
MEAPVVQGGRALSEAATPENIRDTVDDSRLRLHLVLASRDGLMKRDQILDGDIEALVLVLQEVWSNLEWLKRWTAEPAAA